LISIT